MELDREFRDLLDRDLRELLDRELRDQVDRHLRDQLCRGFRHPIRLVGHEREQVSTSTAIALQQIIERYDPIALAQLDVRVRGLREWCYRVLPTDIPRLAKKLWGVLGVLSFNSSGYIREAALLELATLRDGHELPFLLVRLNDWVEQVRRVAEDAVTSRLDLGYAPHFIHCLPLVFRLVAQGRADHAAVTAAIFDLLRRPESRSYLHAALSAADRHVRRLAYRLMVETPGADVRQVLDAALTSEDPILRWSAARELRARLDGEPLRESLERLRSDRLMPVRREALYGFVERLPNVALGPLQAALLDPSSSIREMARFYMKYLSLGDTAAFYRGKLDATKSSELVAAVEGLGKTGTEADGSLLTPFLSHPVIRVRRAAVRALGNLSPETSMDAMLLLLQDSNANVVKAAGEVLKSHAHLIPPDRLWSTFQNSVWFDTRRLVISLMAELKMTWWDWVRLLVVATGEGDVAIREWAISYLHGTGRWNYVPPRLDQIATLEQLLERYQGRLDHAALEDWERRLACEKRDLQ